MYVNLNPRELATILAALRHWQRTGNMACPEWEIATVSGKPLEYNAIDGLCRNVNYYLTGEPAAAPA
jgi:hypothetical protein